MLHVQSPDGSRCRVHVYPSPAEWLSTRVDWDLLRGQKRALAELTRTRLVGDGLRAVEGVLHLLDGLQDLAVDSGLVDAAAVFGHDEV